MLTLNSHRFHDPYDMVIGDDMLTIEFYGYSSTVPYADMAKCVDDANIDIIHKTTAGQSDTPMGTGPYVWSSGNVALCLIPAERLTWSMWSLVPAAMRFFIAENEYKGTQFILIWHDVGPVGYGQLVTWSEEPSLTTANAFPDPFDRTFESLGLTIEFYGYRASISPMAMKECVAIASSEVVRHLLESETPMIMEAPSYSYSAGGVNLFLSPGESLTWHMWAFVPIWIQEFVTENEFKGTQFILLWEGFGDIGFGQLINTSIG